MKTRTAVCAACAVVAGLMLLSGCAAAPVQQSAAAPAMMMPDISQVPGIASTLYVSQTATVTGPSQPAPSANDLMRAAAQKQTEGMTPGAVAGGPVVARDQVVLHISEANAPETAGAKPVLVVPALQPGAETLPPGTEAPWKKPLPPLPSLENK
jgi:hypothetical protein